MLLLFSCKDQRIDTMSDISKFLDLSRKTSLLDTKVNRALNAFSTNGSSPRILDDCVLAFIESLLLVT